MPFDTTLIIIVLAGVIVACGIAVCIVVALLLRKKKRGEKKPKLVLGVVNAFCVRRQRKLNRTAKQSRPTRTAARFR
jgi:hypothetical protein